MVSARATGGAEVVNRSIGAPQDLWVYVGVPDDLSALRQEGRLLLLVEADLEIAHRLSVDLQGREQLAVCADVMARQSGTPVRWHRFNDRRLDGPWAQERWGSHFPNLVQIGEEERTGRRLEDAITALMDYLALSAPPALTLVLQQGDPLDCLMGLGVWTQHLCQIDLAIPQAVLEARCSSLSAWMEEQAFGCVEASGRHWRPDPVLHLRRELERVGKRTVVLEEELQVMQAERSALMAERDQFLIEQKEWNVRQRELQAQRDAFIAERDQLLLERNQ